MTIPVKKAVRKPKSVIKKKQYEPKEGRNPILGIKSDKEFIEQTIAAARQAGDMLLENHEMLAWVSFILNKSQPPMKGKLEIRWWKKKGRVHPHVVQWMENGMPEVIAPTGLGRKANSRARFELNHFETKQLLEVAEELFKSRAAILKQMNEFKRQMIMFENLHHQKLVITKDAQMVDHIENCVDQKNLKANSQN